MKIAFTVSVLFVFVLASDCIVFSAEKHKCDYCHISHGTAGGLLLKAPLSDLCFECHPDRKTPNEHRVDIVPSMQVGGLPLSKDGKMTCITCHDPHGQNSQSKFLRMNPSELCLKCHFNDDEN